MNSHQRPSSREGFGVALICALPSEFDALCMIVDEFWDEDGDGYGRANGDRNLYVTGRMGRHNVVITLLGKGKVKSATAATSLRTSYPNIRLAILVGVCGGIPTVGEKNISLGDVIISDTVIQYDFGHQIDQEFIRKKMSDSDSAPPEILNFLEMLQTSLGKRRLSKDCARFVEELKIAAARSGEAERYKTPFARADTASSSMAQPLVLRGQNNHMFKPSTPTIHFGPMASGDTVMLSAERRDRIAKAEGVIAFEMEGAGLWQELPCIIVKGVSDFADRDKTKDWQDYAAAMAAATSKAILERYIHTDVRDTAPLGQSTKAKQHGSNYSGTIKSVDDVSQGNQMRVSSSQPPRVYEQAGSTFMADIESGKSVRQGNVMEFF
ncbi:MTA SAH nucleosidase [Fusarium beomiforme]|uniref:MTA SAH nucleosidase n=1 Tax=Fusarium beomiforme TaxID=44412 RepID=A0A9P5DYN4_9HYPO|nr:MTA SAH nucleosidase [Fusarium beomiforme]